MMRKLLSSKVLLVLLRDAGVCWTGSCDLSSPAYRHPVCSADISLLPTKERCTELKESLMRDRGSLLGEIERQEGLLMVLKFLDDLVSNEKDRIAEMRGNIDKERDSIRREEQAKDAGIARLQDSLRTCSDVRGLKTQEESGMLDEGDDAKLQGLLSQKMNDCRRSDETLCKDADMERLEAEKARLEGEFAAFMDAANERIRASTDEIARCEQEIQHKEDEFMQTEWAINNGEDEDYLITAQEKARYYAGSAALCDLIGSNRERLDAVNVRLAQVDARMHELETER